MMEKTGKSSEFSAAYKLKSGSSLKKKDARLHRRSIEWKSLRGEEVDKRRNLKNLSPLQEIKENQHLCSMYKDKTPTKPNKGGKPNDMREKLKRWREEKALKKKMDAQEKAKKKPFIIKHAVPTEKINPSAVKREVADPSKSKSNTMPLQPKPQNKETRANKSATVSKKQSSSIMQKESSAKKSIGKPVTERVTRSTNSRSAIQNGGKQLKDKAGSCKKSATKKGKASTVDLRKVSTARGMSFAPDEFAFTAPNNLASFVFKPLSPASCENFLFSNNPDETAAFVATDAGRCSTPKKERAGSKMTSSDEEKTGKKSQDKKNDESRAETSIEMTKTRRQTRSQTKSISSRNDSLSIMDISENESRSRTRKSSNLRMSSSSPSKQTSSKTPSRSRKSLRSGSIASVEEGSRKRSSSRELPSRSRSRKRSRSQEDRGTEKRRKSRRSVSINTRGNVQVDLMTSPEQQPKSPESTENIMETDNIENTVEEEEKSVVPNEPHDPADDEMDSNRSVKLSNHSLTVEVTEKHSPGSSLKARTSIGTKDGLENIKKVPSPSVEKTEALNNRPAKNRKTTRRSLNPIPKMSDDTKELAAEEEENLEVFEEEPSSTPKRKSRRSIRLRPDFAEIPESFASGDKENAKPSRPTRRSVAVVDGFKLPSESLSAKRSKPKQRRHTLHIAKSPEEWVEILKSSPMVEMSRRTPKQKSPVSRLPALDLELDLDDLNLPPKEDIQSDLDISKVIMANLSAEEADLCPDKAAVEPMEVNSSDQGVEQVDPAQTQDQCPASTSSGEQLDQEHDVNYFRNLLISETDRFNVMCKKWETINTPELTEEVQGQIRTVIGQAQLIISQRFKQFSGLVDDCEFKLGEKETTCTDLQGFWDMIYFQVEDVDKKFEDLQKQREAGWVKKSPEPVKKVVKKKNVNKPVLKKPVKSKFAAFKASLKSSAAPAQTIEHDWGLFKVTSPLRKPSYHCEAGSPKPKPAESPMPLQPRPDLSQPEEENQSQPVSGVQQNPPTIAVEDVSVVRTPKRQSYLPIIPSPLLQDCTPQPRFTRSLLKHTPLNATEDKIETPRPRRQSLRRSINLKRKSVSFMEEPEKPESPANESFSKYLQPSQCIPEETNSPVSIMDSYFSEAASKSPVLSSGGKSAKSTLKSDRRRSARRSVSFCSPLPEKDKSSSLRQPPTPHRSLVEEPDSDSDNQSDNETKFATLNVAFTPITRSTRSRPSLLYTPPDLGSPSQKSSAADVAIGTLISFSP
nr:disks large-associated protein 5 isoform X2 [Crassostrea gigas]